MKNLECIISFFCRLITLILVISFTLPQSAKAFSYQEKDILNSRISLYCIQKGDDSVQLISKLRYRQDRQYFNIPGAEIVFTGNADEDPIDLGITTTDDNGEAVLVLSELKELTLDDDSLYTVYASFKGNENYGPSKTDFQFKRAKVEVVAEVVDSTYQLNISTFQLDQSRTPIGDQDIYVMVPRMFSNLTLANDYSDEEGNLTVTIPSDLPANQDGSLELIIQIPDTDEHGTLETRINTDWGVPQMDVDMVSRALWTPDAPLWMLFTFVFLMLVVWGHYAVIIYKLKLVRDEGNKLKKEYLT